jgi:hypothetical protein
MVWTYRHDEFDAHLMFVPPGTDSRPVPLKHIESGWRGHAQYLPATNDWHGDPPAVKWQSPAADTSAYPTWSANKVGEVAWEEIIP